MTKIRFRLKIVFLFVLAGVGLWMLKSAKHAPSAESALVPASSVIPTTRVQSVIPATTTPSLVSLEQPAPPAESASTGPSIGSLLADSSLDNKVVMDGLAKITLDASRNLTERTEAMSHLLNLSVADPAPVLLPLISDDRLPDSLCNQILDDALNDSLSWQADAYLAALRHRADKEMRAKAREHLTFLLDADYGDNLVEWTKVIDSAKAKWAQPAN